MDINYAKLKAAVAHGDRGNERKWAIPSEGRVPDDTMWGVCNGFILYWVDAPTAARLAAEMPNMWHPVLRPEDAEKRTPPDIMIVQGKADSMIDSANRVYALPMLYQKGDLTLRVFARPDGGTTCADERFIAPFADRGKPGHPVYGVEFYQEKATTMIAMVAPGETWARGVVMPVSVGDDLPFVVGYHEAAKVAA